MKRLLNLIEITHKALTENDWDSCIIISADEGLGKSHLALHLLEHWYKLRGVTITSDLVNHINLDIVKWAENLKDCKKFDCSILDEAGELSNKRSMTSLNYVVSRSYQIIRGDNLFTILILPSLFDLDSFFTRRRARGLIHVYQRGKVAFWSRERLRKLIALNQFKQIKNLWVVRPTFYDTFPKYKGILKSAYDDKKREYMKDTRANLYQEVSKLKGNVVDENTKKMIELKKQGKSYREIGSELNVPYQTVYSKLSKTNSFDV